MRMKNPGELAIKLQKARKLQGITYQQLAQKTDLSIATIESIFQGKQQNPTLTTLQRICDVLELSIDQLINRKDFLFYKKGNKTIFSHDRVAKDITVDAKLLAKIEDPENLFTIALLEANENMDYKILIPYDLIKIMLVKGSISVNKKKLKPFEMFCVNKKELQKGVVLHITKGSRGTLCFFPGVSIRI